MSKKAYLEITNACNLTCSFCHGTKREIKYMTPAEFAFAAERIRPFADYLFFHLMGEPLLHPHISELFEISARLGFKVIITTNGTLLGKNESTLLSSESLHKVSISLHCYEANQMGLSFEEYLYVCFDFCKKAAEKGIIAVLRLWNEGGADTLNNRILSEMHNAFPEEWEKKYSGYRLSHNVFLEWGELFEWPDMEAEKRDSRFSCYGLRDQFGVLSDGTVVPCCLDAEGEINLGNIFNDPLEDILDSDRAKNLKASFQRRCVCEELCLRCGYAHSKKY
ncbi:MAG: radical SAM protein [Ruminococcaceae bacterium]|nr:radical SAM protein [Oscillospiraceae bacterium]